MGTYVLHELLDFGSKRVFTLWGDGKIDFLPRGGSDIISQISEVGGGLEVDFTVVFVHDWVFCLRRFVFGSGEFLRFCDSC